MDHIYQIVVFFTSIQQIALTLLYAYVQRNNTEYVTLFDRSYDVLKVPGIRVRNTCG